MTSTTESVTTALQELAEHPAAGLSSRQKKYIFPALTEFLQKHQPRVGQILAGEIQSKWTKADVRNLEKLVANKAPTLKAVEDFLRVLRKLCRLWGLEHRTFVPLPRIPIVPPEVKNPFRRNFVKATARYEAWKRVLARSICKWKDDGALVAGPSSEPDISDLIVSAILYGGLLSASQIFALIRTLPDLSQRMLCVDGRMHVELSIDWHGVPDVELRRWQPDPLTATILMRIGPDAVKHLLAPDQGQPCSDRELKRRIDRQLRDRFPPMADENDTKVLFGFTALLQAAQVIAYMEIPVVVAAFAAREFLSNAFPRSTLKRLSKGEFRYLSQPAAPVVMPRRKERNVHVRLASHDDDYGQGLRSALQGNERHIIRQQLKTATMADNFLCLMADFADHLLAVPSLSGKLPSVGAVRDEVLLLVEHLGCIAEGRNVARKAPDDLEALYVQILEGTGVPAKATKRQQRLRSRLSQVVQAFDEYLGVRYKKPPVSDRSIFFCGETFSEVDANILSVEEFHEILQRIDGELVDVLTPVQRRIARILEILGFRCGLRRLEALHLQVQDLFVDRYGWPVELIIRPSDLRGLKSIHARRRLTLLDIPRHELQELKEWYEDRVGVQHASRTDFLFGDITANLAVIPQTIFSPINDVTWSVAGGHYHHLRHSAATGLITRLLLADMEPIPDFFPHLAETSAWLRSGKQLHRTLYKHDKHTRKHSYKLAQFCGHASPATSYSAYVHLMDFILAASIAQSFTMSPDVELVRAASGAKRTTLQGWEKDDNSPMAIPLKLFMKRSVAIPEPPSGTVVKAASHADTDHQKGRNWTDADWNLHYSIGTWRRPLEEVASIRRVELSRAQLLNRNAQYVRTLRSAPNVFRHRMESWCPDSRNPSVIIHLDCPLRPVQPHDKYIADAYARDLEKLATSDDPDTRRMFQTALDSYVHRVWRKRNWVVFHSTDEADEARNYVSFLSKLGIFKRDIGLYSFDTSVRGPNCVAWRKALGSYDYRIEIVHSPNPEADSTRAWFAIMPRFQPPDTNGNIENPGSYGFRFLLVMAFISFGQVPGATDVNVVHDAGLAPRLEELD